MKLKMQLPSLGKCAELSGVVYGVRQHCDKNCFVMYRKTPRINIASVVLAKEGVAPEIAGSFS